MFVGLNTLIIEGVSDLVYLTTMDNVVDADLDPRWTLTPVGGADKVQTFVALLGAQRLNLAALLDIQKGDEQKIDNLYKRKLLDKKHVLTFAAFTNTSEADIEDMFDPAFYLGLVNAEYSKELSKPIALADLTTRHPRILVRIETFLKAHPLKSGSFNHYRPARYLSDNIASLAPKIDERTRKRFDAVFTTVNALLH
jgi:hypothetical protein